MKYHALFSSKDESKKIKLLKFLFGALRINSTDNPYDDV